MWVLQGIYGQDWEDLTAEETREAIRARKREYEENEGALYRIVRRKEPETSSQGL